MVFSSIASGGGIEFIRWWLIIQELLMDQLPFVRNHMISYVFELLRDKPEQEQLLLRLLVNKMVYSLFG